MTDDDFIAALQANPADDALPHIYADWLDERGDPRGEYLRIILELVNASGTEFGVAHLRDRLQALSDRIDTDWLICIHKNYADALWSAWRSNVYSAPLDPGGFSASDRSDLPVQDWFAAAAPNKADPEPEAEHIQVMRGALRRMKHVKGHTSCEPHSSSPPSSLSSWLRSLFTPRPPTP